MMGICWKRLGLSIGALLSITNLLASDVPLIDAVKSGDARAVQSLLRQRVNVDGSEPDGATALAWATYQGDLETVKLLITAGANVNMANQYGVAPLSLACAAGNGPIVAALVKAGADTDSTTLAGDTALMECARTGRVDAVKLLLEHGVDVNFRQNHQGQTALMGAVAAKQSEVVRVLVAHNANVNARSNGGFTPLLFASQQGDLESARILLDAGADVNAATPDGDTPLMFASFGGHEALSIFLLEKGADPNAAERNGITALHYAILNGLQRMVGVSQRRPFAPYLYRPNMPGLVKALLAHGANPNARLDAPPVDHEAGPGYGKIIRIENGAYGSVSPVGATPFLLAAISYDAPLMRILLEGGANPKLATTENVTALMLAAALARHRNLASLPPSEERQALDAVKVAWEAGIDVNEADSVTGLTALHGSAFWGANTIIQFLVDKGAKLDAKDSSGQTPLHKALNIKPAGDVPRRLLPAMAWQSTADLLVKLGATPVKIAEKQAAEAPPTQAQ